MDTPEHDECQGDCVGVDEQLRKYSEALEEEASCKKVEVVIHMHALKHTHTHTYTLTLQVAH